MPELAMGAIYLEQAVCTSSLPLEIALLVPCLARRATCSRGYAVSAQHFSEKPVINERFCANS